MGRHSKHVNSREFFTASEREKARQTHGTVTQRLGGDSQRRFDECGLCLGLLRDPVATPYGSLYCRECILANLLAQKQALDEQRRAFEDAAAEVRGVEAARAAAARTAALDAFARQESAVVSTSAGGVPSVTAAASSAAAGPAPVRQGGGAGVASSAASTVGSTAAGSVVGGGGASVVSGGASSASVRPSAAASGSGGSGVVSSLTAAAPGGARSSAASSAAAAVAAAGGVVLPTKMRMDARDDAAKLDEVKRTAFWVPQADRATASTGGSAAAAAPAAAPAAPDPAPRDPSTGGFLRAKQLVTVRLTPAGPAGAGGGSSSSSAAAAGDDDDAAASVMNGGSRWACPGCSKPIVYQATYLLKGCGHVVCGPCLSALVAPSKRCLTCSGPAATKADIVKLQQGGSSFAGNTGTIVQASKYTPNVF